MAEKLTPRTCPECNLMPTQHICGLYFVNYVCDICSQQHGVPEGIFRCNKCALNPSNLPRCYQLESYLSPTLCYRKTRCTCQGQQSSITQPYNSLDRIPSSCWERWCWPIEAIMPSDINPNDIDTSQNDISVNNGAIDKLVAQVKNNNPAVHNHTIPEIGESVVAEKGHDDQLIPIIRWCHWHQSELDLYTSQ